MKALYVTKIHELKPLQYFRHRKCVCTVGHGIPLSHGKGSHVLTVTGVVDMTVKTMSLKNASELLHVTMIPSYSHYS
jgi:hypothetical protein